MVIKMVLNRQIEQIVAFVVQHPQSLVSRRICREVLGAALENVNAEFASELGELLKKKHTARIDSYYTLIR